MPSVPRKLPDTAEERALVQRLGIGDRISSSELATIYLSPLVRWLGRQNPTVDPALVEQAAGEAILSLIRNPGSYRPELKRLFSYLCMAAQGDLKNVLRDEKKHYEGRVSWTHVELSAKSGKYLGRNDDPSLSEVSVSEEEREISRMASPSVRDGLTDPEIRALELMLRKERRYAVYAEVLGITHLSRAERTKEVKRLKDRLQKRLERAGGGQ